MDKEELIKMLDGYMESGGSYFKAADGKILTDISSGKSEGEKRETAPILTDKANFSCPTCADIPNISTKPDNEE
ncbi:MAG: hypothetical protein ACI4RH_04120 [Huintestinicola sp.]